jgi:PIN domain nuclease of toxin-antitoxin system
LTLITQGSNGFKVLPIEPRHTEMLTTLPLHHWDPFDRLMVSQAMVEEISLVSIDPQLDAYPIKRIW